VVTAENLSCANNLAARVILNRILFLVDHAGDGAFRAYGPGVVNVQNEDGVQVERSDVFPVTPKSSEISSPLGPAASAEPYNAATAER
jgi:hypothetical protein